MGYLRGPNFRIQNLGDLGFFSEKNPLKNLRIRKLNLSQKSAEIPFFFSDNSKKNPGKLQANIHGIKEIFPSKRSQ